MEIELHSSREGGKEGGSGELRREEGGGLKREEGGVE